MKILDGSPPSTAIRTPDQRLRVFVSSTLVELAAERDAARAAIEQLRLAPVMFESGARIHPPQAVYRAYLGQSDIFIGIYWQRYGWVGPGMTISGLAPWYQGRTVLPVLGKVRSTRYVDRVQVRLVSGQSAAQVADVADNLAHGFGAILCRVRSAKSGAVLLELSAVTPWPRSCRPPRSRPTPTCGRWKSAAAKTASRGWSSCTAPTS